MQPRLNDPTAWNRNKEPATLKSPQTGPPPLLSSYGESFVNPPTPDARDSRFASNPFVVQNGRDFAMFYYGFRYQRPGRACVNRHGRTRG